MRLNRARRRSLGGWVVLFCALLAMGFYVAFDLLDLDGSDLYGCPLRNAIVAFPAQTDAELFPVQDPANSEMLGLSGLPPALQFVPYPAKGAPRVLTATLTARPSRIHLCVQARRSFPPPSSPTGDPV